MGKIIKIIIAVLVLAGLVFPVGAVLASSWNDGLGNLSTYVGGLGFEKDLETPLAATIAGALALLGVIFLALTVYAGFLWMTASGNSERVDKARQTMTAAVIGIVIITAAYAVTYFITRAVGAGSGTSAGDDSNCPGGKCIGPDDECPGGTIIEGFTSCRCCIKDEK